MNENTNGLLRQFFPKQVNFNEVSGDKLRGYDSVYKIKLLSKRVPNESGNA